MLNSPKEGGVNGQQLDAVSFLLTQLSAHFAPFGEETRLQAMSELMQFRRQRGERTDPLIARYRSLRFRASQCGTGMIMNWEGYSWILLRACGVTMDQLLRILQPLNNRYPFT